MVFGNGTGPTDGLTAAQFAGGTFLRNSTPDPYLSAASAWTVECFFTTTATPAAAAPMVLLDQGASGEFMDLRITTLGKLAGSAFPTGAIITSAASVNDGLVHHAALTLTSGGVLTLYLDGASAGTASSVALLTAPLTRFNIAANDFVVGFAPFVGTLSHATSYSSALSAGRVASHAAVLTGFSETTAARFTRLASYAGATVNTPNNSGQLMSTQDTSGQSVLDALQSVADAESGVMFADGTGVLQLQGRSYRTLKTTATLALPAEEPSEDTTIPYDTSQLINQVTVTRTGGAEQTYTDPSFSSASGPGPFPMSLDMAVADDASALSRAQWLVNKYKTAAPRITDLTVDPFASITTPASILSLNIGDRVSLVLPSQKWSGSGDYVIEGWSESVAVDTWSITYNVLPWSLFQAAIWDDAGSTWDNALWA
jgi:hypothetical protein